MSTSRTDTPLEQAVKRVARRLWWRRLIYCAFQFGLATLVLVLIVTPLLAVLPREGLPRHAAIGLFFLAEALAAWRLLIRPLRQPIDLTQAALFVDEKHPELENRTVSAIEFRDAIHDERPSWLIARLHYDSWRAVRRIPFRELLDSRRVARWAALGALAWLGVFGLLGVNWRLWGPELAYLAPARLLRTHKVEFTVEPGNVRLRRGANAVVRLLSAQDAQAATILWRAPGKTAWETARMEQGLSAKIHFHSFADLQSDVIYQVRLGAAQSDTYHITVWTPPEVETIDLTYRYPDYLNVPPAETPHGGDITAVAGTQVDLTVHVNKPLKSARLALESGAAVALRETSPNRWEGSLRVAQSDIYRVHLTDPDNAANEFVPKYRITAQPDKPPDIAISFPHDDLEVTSLDEIPFEFKVDDDFGLDSYGLQIEIAGRDEPVRVPMSAAEADAGATRTAEGRHTLMLETFNLTPGDLITWVVWAKDRKPDREEFQTLGYPYFLEIRPFRREFEEAVSDQSAQQNQQQQQGQQGEGAAAAQQKEVLIATWNLRRDAADLKESEFKGRLTKIQEAQRGVQRQMRQRGAFEQASDASAMPKITEAIDQALAALDQARWPQPSRALSEAIRHMQMAHHLLLKSRTPRSQVQMAMNQQQQGAGQNQANNRELQNLEMRRNRNFYEQEQRVQQQREATESVRNELDELARRQKMINEEINRLVSEMQRGDAQRQEELARQLERLREEQRRALEQLDQAERNMATSPMDRRQAGETSRALQQARRQMTRGLDHMRQGEAQQARAAGSRAAQALDEAGQALQRLSRGAAAERVAELQKRLQALGEREDGVMEAIEQMRQRREEAGSLREDESLQRGREEIAGEKTEMARDVRGLLEDAAALAKGAEKSQELMARRLGDWLRETSRGEIPERIEEARRLVEAGIWDPAMVSEQQIREQLAQAEKGLANVAEAAVADDLEGMRRALDELQRLRDEERQRRQLAQAGGPGEQQDRNAARNQAGQPSGQGAPRDRQADGNRPPQDQAERGANAEAGQQQAQAGDRAGGNAQPDQQNPSNNNRPDANADPNQQRQPGARAGAGGGADNRTAEWTDWVAPRSDEEMRRFLERDYQDWAERIRDAEALLPDDSGARQNLGRAREALAGLRRQFRGLRSRPDETPRFDLLKETVGVPLAQAAEELERQIRKQEEAERLILTDEDVVPEKYRKRVADYYEALSESNAD